MGDKLTLNATEVAELMGISRPTVYNLFNQDGFPVFSVGKRRLVSKAGLERWIAAQSGEAVS